MVPQTKVFVGSLPQGSKPDELRKLFERFGVVTECDIMNRCGFVHMQTEEQATAAIRGLNNTSFNGGVISVERGRIKERGQRGGGRGGRGGMRGGMDRRGGGPMRGAPGPGRDAPYMRDARPMGHMRGHMGGGMGARNGMPYERGPERPPPPAASYDDRYGGYGGEDRRGFALMDRGPRDPYAAPAPMYPDDSRYSNHISVVEGSRRGYSAGMGEELAYDERRLYDERDVLERRSRGPVPHAPHAAHAPHAGYERAPPRPPPAPQPDMYSRREPMYAPQDNLRGPAGPAGYDRDPYAQQYPPMGRYYGPS
ncbi:TATA-binding protein-associated factor 2N isoform X2 [Manduca sexta]|uniref:TATA-binding protein-associated factor 2N isoform X2 n=1 Tax=Manduca sexta TaxID=7130 RepID=UPI00188F5D74|nr:TATA-binding protein-associated factor 2N isoform X2 [Manduca sexta]